MKNFTFLAVLAALVAAPLLASATEHKTETKKEVTTEHKGDAADGTHKAKTETTTETHESHEAK